MTRTAKTQSHEYLFRLAAVTLTVFVIHVAKPVLVPLALAVLAAFIMSPVVGLAQRLGLNRVASTMLTLLVTAGVVAGLAVLVGSQIASLATELPSHQAEIADKLDHLRTAGAGGPFSRLADMVHDLARDTEDPTDVANPPVRVRVDQESALIRAIDPALTVLEPVATAGLVTVLTVFILLGREDLRSRFLAAMGQGRMIGMVRVMDDSASRVGRYLLFQLLVNAGLGAMLGAGMALMGVPYAPLWGFLTATLRFIPYVGTWLAMLLPLTLSFATAPDWHQPVMLLGYFIALDLATANVLEPLLFGHHTGVSPIALLVAAAFWAWVWGPIGLLLSTPLTVCLTVLGQHIPTVRSLGLMLGDKPALAPHIEFYQRVLADDAPTAGAPVAVAVASQGAMAAFDQVLIPALALAHRDRVGKRLLPEEEAEVRQSALAAIGPVLSAAKRRPTFGRRLVVVAAPAHLECEEVPLQMLGGVLDQQGGQVRVMTARNLPDDVIRQVEASRPSAVVISNMPPGGLPQTANLCRLLRERFPDLLVIVARWGGRTDYDQRLVGLRKAGASYLATSLEQTVAQLRACTDSSVAEPMAATVEALTTVPTPAP